MINAHLVIGRTYHILRDGFRNRRWYRLVAKSSQSEGSTTLSGIKGVGFGFKFSLAAAGRLPLPHLGGGVGGRAQLMAVPSPPGAAPRGCSETFDLRKLK